MKRFNKQILEAIQKGLNFALDELDLEDNEGEFSLSRQLYKSKSMKQEYIEHYFVDLGLPSGTIWCKYNLGCDFGLLFSKPESTSPKDWYGKYYAWGEVEEKDCYDWNSYKFGKNISTSKCNFVNYCTKSKYGYEEFTDDLSELLLEDDAAYQYNSSWRMPTAKLCQELINYTNSRWISGKGNDLYMNVEGLAGRLFTSKINENQLFIPAAGYKINSSLYDDGSNCNLWSSSLNVEFPNGAWYLYFYSGTIRMFSKNRLDGLSVRPVLL